MGLPDKSPISDFFQGTMYMTLGCSRSPVTVAVPKFNRSAAPGALDAGAAFDAALGGAGATGAGGDGVGDPEVLARGSPASICAVDLGAGLAVGGAEACAGTVSCAAAKPQRPADTAPTKSQEYRCFMRDPF